MSLKLVGGLGDESGQGCPRENTDDVDLDRRVLLALGRICAMALGTVSDSPNIRGVPVQNGEGGASVLAPVSSPIVEDLNAWELDRKRRNKRGIHADRIRLDSVVKGCGWRTIEEATPDSFLNWLAEQRRTGWRGATANKVQTLLSTLLADVHARNPSRCPVNWAKGLQRASTDDSDDGSRPLTWQEFSVLLAWCRKHAPGRLAAYIVMGYSGMRYSEGRRLMLSEVRLDENPRIELTRRTKRGKKRTIPIHADILPIVRRLIGKRKDGPVFTEFPTVRTLQYDCARAKVDSADVGYHSLRKCFAGRCATTGVPLAIAQKLLGHSDPKLTANIYMRFADHELAEHLACLGGAKKKKQEIAPKTLDTADALCQYTSAETLNRMDTNTSTSRSSVPGREGAHATSQQRGSAAFRPGTEDRESHLRDLNPGPMLYESTRRDIPGREEALARLFHTIGDLISTPGRDAQGGVA